MVVVDACALEGAVHCVLYNNAATCDSWYSCLKPLHSVSAVTVFNIKPQFLEPVRRRIGSTESFIIGTRSFIIGTDKSWYPVPQKSGTAGPVFNLEPGRTG